MYRESVRAKPAHGGVKTKNFAQIVLIYAGLERSKLASASAKHKQLIAAVFDALLPSRPWFCPRKPRALPPVSGEAGCSVAADDLRHGCLAPICSAMSPLFTLPCSPAPAPFPASLTLYPSLSCVAFLQRALLFSLSCGTNRRDHGTKLQQNNKQ